MVDLARLLPALGLALALSGCLGALDDVEAVEPRGEGEAWTSWEGPMASASYGCGGPCAGTDANGPEFTWVGVDGDGRVLRIGWALGPAGLRFMNRSLEPWNATVAAVFADGDEYGQHGGGVRVFAVQALRLDGDDRPRVARVLDDAMGRLQPLGPPVYGCDDCGAHVLKADGLRAELMGNVPKGSGWPLLDQQLHKLSEWAGGEQS